LTLFQIKISQIYALFANIKDAVVSNVRTITQVNELQIKIVPDRFKQYEIRIFEVVYYGTGLFFTNDKIAYFKTTS
jgi:hypothetical protein